MAPAVSPVDGLAFNGIEPSLQVVSWAAPRVIRPQSSVDLPAFDGQARAHDIFIEESQVAMLGMKEPSQAMADAARRVQPLIGS